MLSKARIQRRSTLADQVYEIICESITAGELKSGERLVLEQLAPKLGVSQTPVREAVIRLVKDGLVIEGSDGKLQVVPLTQSYVIDIFMVRSVLEGLAAELAAPQLSANQFNELHDALEHASKGLAEGNVGAYHRGGSLLHQRVIEVAGSPALSRELRSLQIHVDYIISYSQRHMGDHLMRSQDEHWQILNALMSRDPAVARQIVESHIRNSGKRIAELIEFDPVTDAVLMPQAGSPSIDDGRERN